MQRDPKKFFADMLKAVVDIQTFTKGRQFSEFVSDQLLRSAVYWEFAIIGEALSQLRKLDEAIADTITDAWRIIGFRNQILHGYPSISDEITWRIIHDKLPILKAELETLLAR